MSDPASNRHLYWAVAAAACLAVAGGAAFYYATLKNAEAARGQTADRTVTITATACEPMELSVPGGRRSFEIINASDRPIEWEILDGVMVLAERENIAPGFRAGLTVQLQPGSYQMACGLLSNPRGTLIVTPSDEAAQAASEVTLRKFLGPLSEYRVYLVMQGNAALKSAQDLRAAIASGDVAAAQTAWAAARLPWRHIQPLAYRFSDLEGRIDARATYLAGREEDPAFTGYHRLEYGLFARNSTEGLLPVADQLVTDLEILKTRLREAPLDPQLLISLPVDTVDRIAQGQITEGENIYAGNDLADLQASVEGVAKLVGLLRAVVAPVDPRLDERIGARLAQVQADIDALKQGGGFPPYATVPADRRAALATDMTGLGAALGALQDVIGMN
ncbi:iron uptake system protein EfeO [Paenirhodobacter populi]|uniref:Iron uptake system protein EfeO n=1 Tax=Paenirhodobacter populi TaxID=2306993 RepID=A0A443JSV9_9RHOB|nr:iron uptake system protein EfeO [Sinirhodobacter populi]RWR23566.1 iron uptake system protein EfeO [Sinirhodobacter populi]